MRRATLCLISIWVICLVQANPAWPQSAAGGSAAEQLHTLLNEAWKFELRENPLFATHAGDNRFNDQLPRENLVAAMRRTAARREFLVRLQDIPRDKLGRVNQINYDMFSRQTRNQIAEYEFQAHLTPITGRSGFHIAFPDTRLRVPLNTVQDFDNYIARLRGFAQYANDHIELLRAGIQQGFTLPDVVLEGYREPLKAHLTDDATASIFYEPFRHLPKQFSSEEQARLCNAAQQAIAAGIVHGYRGFLNFLEEEYLPAARGSIGASALPRGREFYRHRVARFTTLDITPEEVHQIGLREVARIHEEMQTVIKRTGFTGEMSAFVEHLRSEPKFYATSPEELLRATALVLKRMDGQLPKLFKTLPRTPYGIREVPAYIAPRTTTAYYMQPAGDGSRAGFYYVNTFNLRSRPLFEVEALSLHEAVPGHHVQLALQQELRDLPNFRRFSEMTVFVEGWGLYSERLGLETGFYQDPYSDFGRLSYEMWRACRLVVDTGMHYLGWSRQQAIDFMETNTALSLHNIRAEVDRYIAWPGQALAYKIGELKIRELRALAERELGDRFDIREFHDVVLGSGAVPLSVLEENVKAYLAR